MLEGFSLIVVRCFLVVLWCGVSLFFYSDIFYWGSSDMTFFVGVWFFICCNPGVLCALIFI